MMSAGEEERTLANAQNRCHQDVSVITVILDGGQCKQTYEHTDDAKSGVKVITENWDNNFWG